MSKYKYIKEFNEVKNLSIRKTEPSDIKLITSIINSPDLNSYGSDDSFSEGYIGELSKRGYSIVATEGDKIVGFIVGERLISSTGLLLLHWVWRSPTAESRDIFNSLMSECKREFTYINSYINEGVVKSFEKQGFNIGNKGLIEVCWSK